MSETQPAKRTQRSSRRKNKSTKKKEYVARKKAQNQKMNEAIQKKKEEGSAHLENPRQMDESLTKKIEIVSTPSNQPRIMKDCRYQQANEEDLKHEEALIDLDNDDPDDSFTPPEGILIEGIPLHHRAVKTLTKQQQNILLKHGVILRKGQFTSDEDEKIRRNWRDFADEYNLPDENAKDYLILDKHKREERRGLLRFIAETGFRPKLCKGLLLRSGRQVFFRAQKVLVYNRSDRKNVIWTAEDDQKLLGLYRQYGVAYVRISREMNRDYGVVVNRIMKLTNRPSYTGKDRIKGQEIWNNNHQLKLYIAIKDVMLKHPVTIALKQKKIYEKYESAINWEVVATSVGRPSEECSKRWEELKTILRAFADSKELSEPREIEVSFFGPVIEKTRSGIRSESCYKNELLTNKKLAKCVKLMNQEGVTRIGEIDVNRLTSEISERGINFTTTWSLGEWVKIRAGYILYHFGRWKVFETCPSDITFQEKLDLLAYVLKKSTNSSNTTHLEKQEVRKLVDKYMRKKGWEFRHRIVLVCPDDEENPSPVIRNEELISRGIENVHRLAPQSSRKRRRNEPDIDQDDFEPEPIRPKFEVESPTASSATSTVAQTVSIDSAFNEEFNPMRLEDLNMFYYEVDPDEADGQYDMGAGNYDGTQPAWDPAWDNL